jgi:hypothetical protein
MNDYTIKLTLEDGSRISYHIRAENERDAEEKALSMATKEYGEAYL